MSYSRRQTNWQRRYMRWNKNLKRNPFNVPDMVRVKIFIGHRVMGLGKVHAFSGRKRNERVQL